MEEEVGECGEGKIGGECGGGRSRIMWRRGSRSMWW